MSGRIGMAMLLLTLGGCAHLEDYHKPVTFSEVPAPVLVGISEKYPNVTIRGFTQQVMMDGTARYTVAAVDKSNKPMTFQFRSDGTELP